MSAYTADVKTSSAVPASSSSSSAVYSTTMDRLLQDLVLKHGGSWFSNDEEVVGQLFSAWLKSKGLEGKPVGLGQLNQFLADLKTSEIPAFEKLIKPVLENLGAVVQELNTGRGWEDKSFLEAANTFVFNLEALKKTGFDLKNSGLDGLLASAKKLVNQYNNDKQVLVNSKASEVEFLKLASEFRANFAEQKKSFLAATDSVAAQAQSKVVKSEQIFQLNLEVSMAQDTDSVRLDKEKVSVTTSDLQKKQGETFEAYKDRLVKNFSVPETEIPKRNSNEKDSDYAERIVDRVLPVVQRSAGSDFTLGLQKEKVLVEQKLAIAQEKLNADPNNSAALLEVKFYTDRLKVVTEGLADLQKPNVSKILPIPQMQNTTVNLMLVNKVTKEGLKAQAKFAGDTKLEDKLQKEITAIDEAIQALRKFFVDLADKISDIMQQAARAA